MIQRKKFMSTLMVLTLVLSMMIGTTAFAKEDVPYGDAVSVETMAAASTIVGPDGNTYTYLGTATRNGADNNPVEAVLRQTIVASAGYHVVFYCPNNNRRDLIQGTLTASPVMGGTVESFSFTNYGNEIYDIDLSNLPGSGPYVLRVKAYAYGTSNQGRVYYRVYQSR
ncbi:MAG: hypothetical protein K2J99_14825 [Lachnospiraceae bacterium]|nr:hypothetical protein [Lachnospiraceae bacterium]